MRVLDLFSGIGGFSLGLERAGMQTVAFCEIKPFCQKVLKKHWPEVPIYDDIKTLTADRLRTDGIDRIDVITGGFPCQDLSLAGKQAGITAERSGLWSELARIIGEVRPRYAIVENVTALLSGDRGRWFGRVLGDLAEIGFDAEWHCIPASRVGARHRRDRVWVIAYPRRDIDEFARKRELCNGEARTLQGTAWKQRFRVEIANGCKDWRTRGWADSESDVGRIANELPDTLDRLKGLGNAVVPQIPEILGRAILEVASRG